MPLFNVDATIFKKNYFCFCPLKHEKTALKSFSFAQISPNLIFCFIKMALCATSI